MAQKLKWMLIIILGFVVYSLHIDDVCAGTEGGDGYGKWDRRKTDLPFWALLLSIAGGIALSVSFVFCYFKCCHRGSRIATAVT